MYCKNCGKELQDNESFCSNCGVKAGDVKGLSIDFSKLGDVAGGVNSIRKGIETLGENKNVYLASIICLLANILVIREDMFRISYKIFYTNTTTVSLFEDAEGLGFVFILGYLAAAAALLLPLIMNKGWQKNYFKLGTYVPAAALVWFVVVILRAVNNVSSEMSGYEGLLDAIDLTTELTGSAWVFMITSAAAILLTLKISKALVPAEERAEPEKAQECEQAEESGRDWVSASEDGLSRVERDLQNILGKK